MIGKLKTRHTRAWTSLLPGLVCAILAAGPVSGQRDEPPLRQLRHLLDVQVLGGIPAQGDPFRTSFRVGLQRRLTLNRSMSFSGMLLQDGVSRTLGAALGHSWNYRAGSVLVEPFVEAGLGVVDGRVNLAGYQILTPSGDLETRGVYRAVDGTAGLGGAGLWTTLPLGSEFVTRLGLGYWQVVGPDGFRRGGLRIGAALGLGRRDDRWFELATDRMPPALTVWGSHAQVGDSVAADGGRVTLVANDESGIRRIVVDGSEVELAPVPHGRRTEWGLPAHAVAASVQTEPPFEGIELPVVVEDSAGLRTEAEIRVFGDPDRTPPSLRFDEMPPTYEDRQWSVWARVDDDSGIADARVGRCEIPVLPDLRGLEEALDIPVTTRWIAGWVTPRDSVPLTVRDRAGNARTRWVRPYRPPVGEARSDPVLERVSATARGDGRSVWVTGRATDPAGGWIESVRVNGLPGYLTVLGTARTVDFSGWLQDPAGTGEVQVTVSTQDGRTARTSVSVTSVPPQPDPRLHVLLIGPPRVWDARADFPLLNPSDGEEEELRAEVHVLSDGSRIREDLAELRRTLGPEDAVWMHMAGRVTSQAELTGPQLELDGGKVSLRTLGQVVEGLGVGSALVTTEFATSSSWQVPPDVVPGVRPHASCVGSVPPLIPSLAGVASRSWQRVVSGLSGEADLDGDGWVRMAEILRFLDAPGVGDALTSHDPSTPLVRGEMGR